MNRRSRGEEMASKFMSGTFPNKLWKLVNKEEANGIEWCDEGKKIIIEKKLFQIKCLNQGEFKTQKFLSITKQLNVYGFIQQAHPYTDKYLIYKNSNFRKGRPELLINFARRASVQSKRKEETPTKPTKMSYTKRTNCVDHVALARAHFKAILEENMALVMQLPSGITPPESESDSDEDICPIPSVPPPKRNDPRFMMWNGACHPPKSYVTYVPALVPSMILNSVPTPSHIILQPLQSSVSQWNHNSAKNVEECPAQTINQENNTGILLPLQLPHEVQKLFLAEDFKAAYDEIVKEVP